MGDRDAPQLEAREEMNKEAQSEQENKLHFSNESVRKKQHVCTVLQTRDADNATLHQKRVEPN